jgi:hypothetical protein
MSNSIKHGVKGKRRKHGCDTVHEMHEWTKANKSARRWYHGQWLEDTQEPYASVAQGTEREPSKL